jgi:N-acyl-D-aspartate/D-glutamate deacylase
MRAPTREERAAATQGGQMYDLVIRGGDVVDGTGAPAARADLAVADGRIVRVAPMLGEDAREVIDATGCAVTPGFVDPHTHYDGQATWDDVLEPSTPHGVTTVVTGNCGVGFAPVRPGREGWLIELMEGVEDIPGAALHEGMRWGWESFPEYLDVLGARRWAVDVAVQLPHGPLRGYVMGERGARNEQAAPDDIAEMSRIATEAMEAGAFGFTTSRTLGHTSLDGTPVPGTFAGDDELFAIARAVRAGGGRVFEVAMTGIVPFDDTEVAKRELDWIGEMALQTGLTATFIVLQHNQDPTRWRAEMDAASAWRERGAHVVPLVAGRPFGVLLGWDIRHPFRMRPSYEAIDCLPRAERLKALRRADLRDRILSEQPAIGTPMQLMTQAALMSFLPTGYVLRGAPDYEQPAERSLRVIAERAGTTVEAAAYDALLETDDTMLLLPLFNYSDTNHDALFEQMQDPSAVLGLADGGAHCATICDASMPTYVLTHWVRDRTRGPRLPLEDAVRRLTSQPAELYGLTDRGRIAEGLRADLNVVDLPALTLHAPRAVADLPAGGTRVLQDATGYRATIVQGVVTRRDGVDTGARPGRLVRNGA